MDSIFGVKGDGFVILAADAMNARSILVYKDDYDKIKTIDETKIMGLAGPNCDVTYFSEYIQKNMALYELNNGISLSTHAAAHLIRGELATALRKGPWQTNILFGGYDQGEKEASLYFIDYMGSAQKVNYGAQGYASNFTLSVFDRMYKKNCTKEEGLEMIKACINEINVRFLINQPRWVIKVVSTDGIEVISKAEKDN